MTHSLYIHDPNGYGVELLYELPREVWENDIDGALNYSRSLPTEGKEALADSEQDVPTFHASPPRPDGGKQHVQPTQHQRFSCASREPDPERQPDRQHRHVERDQRRQPLARATCRRISRTQMHNVFLHIRHDIEAAGGSPDDIVKITFWMQDPATGRAAINDEWVKMFPNADSRPARHTLPSGGNARSQVTCEFMAVLGT